MDAKIRSTTCRLLAACAAAVLAVGCEDATGPGTRATTEQEWEFDKDRPPADPKKVPPTSRPQPRGGETYADLTQAGKKAVFVVGNANRPGWPKTVTVTVEYRFTDSPDKRLQRPVVVRPGTVEEPFEPAGSMADGTLEGGWRKLTQTYESDTCPASEVVRIEPADPALELRRVKIATVCTKP
jgi:hypothetical protein